MPKMYAIIEDTATQVKKRYAMIGSIATKVKKRYAMIDSTATLVYTCSEDLLANAGVSNLHANCHTPSSGSNEDYSDTISFSWDDIDNLNIKGYYSMSRMGNGDTHSDDDFEIQIYVDNKWQTIWEAGGPGGGWDTGTWDIDTTIITENYSGVGKLRCYCTSYRLTDHSIRNYLDIDISSLITNV